MGKVVFAKIASKSNGRIIKVPDTPAANRWEQLSLKRHRYVEYAYETTKVVSRETVQKMQTSHNSQIVQSTTVQRHPVRGQIQRPCKKIAQWCSPSATHNPTTPGFGLIGIVANNPKKQSLETFLTGSQVGALNKNITGTKSSSDMAQCITKGKKSSFATFSGPWGGDAQLAGLLAAQKVDSSLSSKPYIDALIFFNENNEAHKEDIASLVAVMKATMKPSDIAFTPTKATALITKLKSR